MFWTTWTYINLLNYAEYQETHDHSCGANPLHFSRCEYSRDSKNPQSGQAGFTWTSHKAIEFVDNPSCLCDIPKRISTSLNLKGYPLTGLDTHETSLDTSGYAWTLARHLNRFLQSIRPPWGRSRRDSDKSRPSCNKNNYRWVSLIC